MSLQNRVDPFGELFASAARGTLFGNRGGRFHRDDKTLLQRRWASRQWICCVLSFKGRRRDVWGRFYTELFFLDEVTALAAGHRPCFECRREAALAFAEAFGGGSHRPSAPDIDLVLHAERLDGRGKRIHRAPLNALPDGAVILAPRSNAARPRPVAVKGDVLLPWTPSGYAPACPRPVGILADLLTPPATVAALSRGYRPLWHPSAATSESDH